jgi:hypothetical protein
MDAKVMDSWERLNDTQVPTVALKGCAPERDCRGPNQLPRVDCSSVIERK